jgi:hypothetical protein
MSARSATARAAVSSIPSVTWRARAAITPSVHAIRSRGTASDRAVGLDIGRITGRSVCAAMSRTTASVNAPGRAEVPIRTVGRTWVTTFARLMPSAR